MCISKYLYSIVWVLNAQQGFAFIWYHWTQGCCLPCVAVLRTRLWIVSIHNPLSIHWELLTKHALFLSPQKLDLFFDWSQQWLMFERPQFWSHFIEILNLKIDLFIPDAFVNSITFTRILPHFKMKITPLWTPLRTPL